MTTADLAPDTILRLPKVLLHDHLDGGLRPATVLELADNIGLALPAGDPDALGTWFAEAADSGSLERYLETFRYTIAVMQTAEGLARVAREAVLDLAADGVVYAEQRWAPEQHTADGLSPQAAIEAVQAGIEEGIGIAEGRDQQIQVGQIVTAMRQNDCWVEIAELAIANRDRGVVGFDIAGPEDGYPPSRHPEVWELLAMADFPVTIHAGEAAGPSSIAQAVHLGQASRIGHGARIVDDIAFDDDSETATLGNLAHWVRDHQIPLEICTLSNLQTGVAPSVAAHPVTRLLELDFAVTVNTDNRLMSRTSLTREMTALVTEAEWTLDDLAQVTLNAAWNAFIHHDERRSLVDDIILPGYQEIEGAML